MRRQLMFVTIMVVAGSLHLAAQGTQKISSGIIVGVSSGSIRISGMDSHIINHIDGDNIFGMEAGFFTKVRLNPFYIKPAAAILYQRGTVDVFNSEGVAYSQSDIKLTKLEIPIQFGANVIGPFSAEIGPVYNHVLGVTTQYNGHNVDVTRNGLGYRAGVNIEMDRLAFGISYQAIRNISVTQGTFDSDEMIFSAAYTFGSGPGMAPYGR
jgi:hypothetical protein